MISITQYGEKIHVWLEKEVWHVPQAELEKVLFLLPANKTVEVSRLENKVEPSTKSIVIVWSILIGKRIR